MARPTPQPEGDREVVLNHVSQCWEALEWASAEFKADREIVLIAVSQSGLALEWASDDLKATREIVLAAVSEHPQKYEPDAILAMARKAAMELFPQDPRELARRLRGQDWLALQWASDDLKGDHEIVLAAISQCSDALQWASDDLRGDRELVLNALSQSGHSLQWASDDLKSDREIVLKAVSQDGMALQWASEDLKGDREIVLNALRRERWRALEWASDDLKEDAEIISQTNFDDEGFLLKVSLLSGRHCTVVTSRWETMSELLGRCSVKLGLDRQQAMATGKLVHQAEAGAAGTINSLGELLPGQVHDVTLVIS